MHSEQRPQLPWQRTDNRGRLPLPEMDLPVPSAAPVHRYDGGRVGHCIEILPEPWGAGGAAVVLHSRLEYKKALGVL